MFANAYDSYLETRVLTADAVELIEILCEAALESVTRARRCLRDKDITGRTRAISRVSAIVTELAVSLDHQRGGNISRRLAALYDYILQRLNEANFQQDEGPLAEVGALLATLLEGWKNCRLPRALPPSTEVASVTGYSAGLSL